MNTQNNPGNREGNDMNARDELADVFTGHPVALGPNPHRLMRGHAQEIAEAVLVAGYRKIFDGDCGLSNVKDPTEKEAAEAWMRWANLASNEDIGAIGAMQIMLTELGYRKPRQIVTVEELRTLPVGSVVLEAEAPGFLGIETIPGVFHLFPHDGWHVVAGHGEIAPEEITLPATVLYEPTP